MNKFRKLAGVALVAALLLPASGLFGQGKQSSPAPQRYPSHHASSLAAAADDSSAQSSSTVTTTTRTTNTTVASNSNSNAAAANGNRANAASSNSGRSSAAAASNSGAGADDGVVTAATPFDSNLFSVEKELVSSTVVGSEFVYRIRVTAREDIENVVVKEWPLEQNLKFVRSTPAAAMEGDRLTWKWDSMKKGEVKTMDVTVVPTVGGSYLTKTKVCIDPVVVLPLKAGSPKLEMSKTGADIVEVGEFTEFVVVVKNVGTAPATGVVVTDNLPEGFALEDGSKVFTANVGDIAQDDSKSVTIRAKALSSGKFVNKADAKSSNGAVASAQQGAPTAVVQSKLAVYKTGAETQFVFRQVTYKITVANEGNSLLEGITVTDKLPLSTQFVGASDNGQQKGSEVSWSIASLQPGQKKEFSVTISSSKPQTTVNEVSAKTSKGFTAAAQAKTEWEGAPGVLTELVDDVDPISVDGFVTYTLRVKNQGTHRAVNANISIILSEELVVDSVSSQNHTVEGNKVTFPEALLKPGTDVIFKVKAKAVKPGLAHARLELNSSFLPRAMVKEESTFVY